MLGTGVVGLWLASICSLAAPLLCLQSVTDKLCHEFSPDSHLFPIVCQGINCIYSYARHGLQLYPIAPCVQLRLSIPRTGVWVFLPAARPQEPLGGLQTSCLRVPAEELHCTPQLQSHLRSVSPC